MAISTLIKGAVNAFLNPIGYKIGTTLADTREAARLAEVDNRGHWESGRYNAGLCFQPERYLRFLDEVVSPHRESIMSFPFEAEQAAGGYYLQNHYFGGVDAEVLYGIVRHRKPKTIIEIGSGFSTRIMRKSIVDGDLTTRIVSIDPAPRTEVGDCVDERLACPVEQLLVNEITERLNDGDFLFIDSSHTVTTGGDVAFLFLEVLPRLKPGVIVHVHDIFLPFDYPKHWIKDEHWQWTEQYLVHAFLSCNSAFEILWPSHFMWKRFPQELLQVIPRGATVAVPASLWIEKKR